MREFDEVVRGRRSVRGFRPDPVPQALLHETLALAQSAPSNCNVQPWRVYVASGEERVRLRDALVQAMRDNAPAKMEHPVDVFPGVYREKQVGCAVELYKNMGIARDDQEGRLRAHIRNFEFFDAPHVAYVCMAEHFGLGVALDVGMYVQTWMLALWSRGVASCAQASLRAYPHIARSHLGIPGDQTILCGVAFGYEDTAVPANKTRQPRDPVQNNVVFVG